MDFMAIPNKRYIDSVPYSSQEYWGVSLDGVDGWDTPEEESPYSEVREALTGTTSIIGYGGKHTWNDWEAYWTDVEIGAPEVETYYVTIPGRMGDLDLSEVLTGAPVFKNREISITLTYPGSGSQWHEEFSEMLAQIHGQNCQMVLDSDPAYYYEGRCTVSSQRQDNFYSTFTITMEADPYKYACADSLGDWLWDPFSFEDGVVLDLGNIVLYYRDGEVETDDDGNVTITEEADGTAEDGSTLISWCVDSEDDDNTSSVSINTIFGVEFSLGDVIETDTEALLYISPISETRPYREDTNISTAEYLDYHSFVVRAYQSDDYLTDYTDIVSGSYLTNTSKVVLSITIPAGAKRIAIGVPNYADFCTYAEAMEFCVTMALYFRGKRL